MSWRSGLVLLLLLSISLFTSAGALPPREEPGVFVTFVETDTPSIVKAPDPDRGQADLRAPSGLGLTAR